jgi:Family of unknown function (DUF5755)
MARRPICPPGILCLTPSLGIFITVLIAFLVGALFYFMKSEPQLQKQQQQPVIYNNVDVEKGDDRYTQAPLPLRFWNVSPDLRGALLPPGAVAINQSTQGLPESYQSMGVIKKSDGSVLPLYGRRTTGSGDRYQYYTRTDTYNPVPLPIRYKRKNCQEDIGCDELFSGEEVVIGPTGEKAETTLYKFDGPTYIPGIV